MDMKEKDWLILSHFRKDARCKLTKLSRKTGIPVSTLFDRLKSYQGSIVPKSVTLLDFGALGYGAKAAILLKVDASEKNELQAHLENNISVNSLYRVNNGFDLMAECVFKTMKDAEEFIDSIRAKHKIIDYQVNYVIDDIKREQFLADPQFVDMVRDGKTGQAY